MKEVQELKKEEPFPQVDLNESFENSSEEAHAKNHQNCISAETLT
jgi:hypothetical protein